MKITWNWGTGIAAIYTAFAIGTISFVSFAINQRVELVSRDYYAASLAHDDHIAAVRNARALGDSLTWVAAEDGRTVLLTLPAEQAETATGTVTLYRPSDATADRTLPLELDADGTQRVSLESLPAGRWILRAQWTSDGREYFAERDVVAR
ncbi:MAG TPA: FixH family protein [Vicinamibacterales bacterium]